MTASSNFNNYSRRLFSKKKISFIRIGSSDNNNYCELRRREIEGKEIAAEDGGGGGRCSCTSHPA